MLRLLLSSRGESVALPVDSALGFGILVVRGVVLSLVLREFLLNTPLTAGLCYSFLLLLAVSFAPSCCSLCLEVTPELEQEMRDYYEPHNLKLQELLGRPLPPNWSLPAN